MMRKSMEDVAETRKHEVVGSSNVLGVSEERSMLKEYVERARGS